MKNLICLAVLLPIPIFSTLPVPKWTTEIQVHNAQPTIVPKTLTHSGLGVGCSDPSCRMCAGQHLRNYHGESYTKLERMGYRKWVGYHKQLHREGVAPKATVQSGCPGGICPTPNRKPILSRFFRGARR